MDQRYQRLDLDHRSQQNYSSINDGFRIYQDETNWFKQLLGSPKLVFFHEKQRAFRARQKPTVLQTFLASIVVFMTVLVFIRSFPSWNTFPWDEKVIIFSGNSNEQMMDWIRELPSSESIREFFLHYASQAHLAGSEQEQALAHWTQAKFIEFGIKNTSTKIYYPYLNYPVERKLLIAQGPEQLLYQASLQESEDSTPTFHAYSADGNVTGPVVYVNYGCLEDYNLLSQNEIKVQGSICLMRHGFIPSSHKLYHAETFGCIGALVFTDSITQPNLVHRETVQYGFVYPGDPYTPGFAAVENATAVNATNLPTIPSLPISWNDALPLLRATQDFGWIEPSWVGAGIDTVAYFTGPSEALVNLVNINNLQKKPVCNVMAHIKGTESEQTIVIGNHRDAWDVGAADPSSGSAVMLELARVFGLLLEKGWKPRRSILLASWDANEYGNVGSTEWVEEHLPWLDKHAVVYLNVDRAVTGSHFAAEASPLLNHLIYEVTSMVVDPHTSQTVFDAWLEYELGKRLNDLSFTSLVQPVGFTYGLDTLAFFQHAGISSLSMSFEGSEYDVSHSTFDSISWMKQSGDPTFEYHQTMVKIWGLLAYRLSTDAILPLHPMDYAVTLKHHFEQLNNETKQDRKLSSALHHLYKTSIKFNAKVENLNNDITTNKKKKKHQVDKINERLVKFERSFIEPLKDRAWYRHAIYAPSTKDGSIQVFPSLVDKEAEVSLIEVIERAEKTLTHKKHH